MGKKYRLGKINIPIWSTAGKKIVALRTANLGARNSELEK